MTDKPDFHALRAQRDAAIKETIRSSVLSMGGDPDKPTFVHISGGSGCYCACPDGPCEHDFKGWRNFADGNGGEQACRICGMGAMSHSLRCGP